ncbi:unnamed protein product [Calypogeia fissa]
MWKYLLYVSISIALAYIHKDCQDERRGTIYACSKNTTTFIGACCVLFAVVTGVTLGVVHQQVRWKVIGAVCVSIGIIQNFAPLMVIRTVIRTKSAEYLPILLSVWIVINGGLWTAYGSWPFDIFIIIPNVFGVAFGTMQVVLWAIYRKNPKTPLARNNETIGSVEWIGENC